MRRWARLLVLVAGGAAIALGVEIARPGSPWVPLAVIGGAIAAGELIELRPPLRAALPVSFAFMVVLARQATVADAALVLAVAELATFLVRSEPTSVEGRLALFAERMLEGMAAVLVYHGMADALGSPPTRAKVLFALGVAALAPIAVAEVARMIHDRDVGVPAHGRMADVALVTSATLMAISDLGVGGSWRHGPVGPGRLHDPAPRGLVLVRTSRVDPAHLRPDDPRARAPRPSSAGWCATATPNVSPI